MVDAEKVEVVVAKPKPGYTKQGVRDLASPYWKNRPYEATIPRVPRDPVLPVPPVEKRKEEPECADMWPLDFERRVLDAAILISSIEDGVALEDLAERWGLSKDKGDDNVA